MALIIEHNRHGKRETVTEAQWEAIKKKFPGMFKKVQPVESYSDEAKAIIDKAGSDKHEEE